ncbi:MAG: hypothetical protein J7L71_06565 [Spirochaetaceae bacterium]|nr:hypothetical protein [Spirochaetaceae bacterium]
MTIIKKDYTAPYFHPTSLIPQATTPPPKVEALKFRIAPTNPNDSEPFDFEFVEIDFVSYEGNVKKRSEATQYFLEVVNQDTGIVKRYVQYVDQRPYTYWQRSVEPSLDPEALLLGLGVTDAVAPEGIVNGLVYVTPFNDYKQGKTSKFFLPMKDLLFIPTSSINMNPTNLILAKYWHLFSKTPEELKNRPKQMHIYIGVPVSDVQLDIEELGQPEYQYNTIGSSTTINDEMFRWVIQDHSMQKVSKDGVVDMTAEEIIYLRLIIDSFGDMYRQNINHRGLGKGESLIFKIAVENPRDHDDSIIIYIMKGQRWEV